MKEILFALLWFVIGWFGNKILDIIKDKLLEKYRKHGLKKKLEKRELGVSLCPNISIIGEGLPTFNIREQLQVNLTKSCFFLSAPAILPQKFPVTFRFNSSKDIWLSGYTPNDINKILNISGFEKQLEESKEEIANAFMERTDGCYFNNRLYGLVKSDGFGRTTDERELPVLSMEFYITDYYTHRVMGNLTNKLRAMGCLPKTNLSVSQLNNKFRFFRTSLGISIIIIMPNTNEIIMTTRSTNSAYSDGKEWIYVSVTETISETDYDNYKGGLNISRWIERALWEELGLQKKHYDENSIRIYDMFFENHFYQDGLTASVCLTQDMDINKVTSLKAKDKKMEIKSVFTIENSPAQIEQYIDENHSFMREQTIFALQGYIARQ